MERIVASSNEYRANAAECVGWAKTAKSVKERDIFLQMANTWLRAAVDLEAASGAVAYRDRPASTRRIPPLKPSDMLRYRGP
jgi:hypothetical protein